jgi:hypothetical protein
MGSLLNNAYQIDLNPGSYDQQTGGANGGPWWRIPEELSPDLIECQKVM